MSAMGRLQKIGQQDEQQQREPRARRRDHVLDAERAARHEDVDHEEDGDDADLRPLEAPGRRAGRRLRCSCAPPALARCTRERSRAARLRDGARDLHSSMEQRGRRPPRPIPRQSWRGRLGKPRGRADEARDREPAATRGDERSSGPARSRARSARRSPAPSLRSTARQWVRAVLGETQSRAAMAGVVSPPSSSTSTSASRAVRPAAVTASVRRQMREARPPATAASSRTRSAQPCARCAASSAAGAGAVADHERRRRAGAARRAAAQRARGSRARRERHEDAASASGTQRRDRRPHGSGCGRHAQPQRRRGRRRRGAARSGSRLERRAPRAPAAAPARRAPFAAPADRTRPAARRQRAAGPPGEVGGGGFDATVRRSSRSHAGARGRAGRGREHGAVRRRDARLIRAQVRHTRIAITSRSQSGPPVTVGPDRRRRRERGGQVIVARPA